MFTWGKSSDRIAYWISKEYRYDQVYQGLIPEADETLWGFIDNFR
jgi:hypothetical protein